ncbi:MAG: hypothetical protein IJF74_04345 [Clostridia bacterium]|nr:hypothetical protein [Clostridia bacterium]
MSLFHKNGSVDTALVNAITALRCDKLLGMNAQEIAVYFTSSGEEIAARQKMIADCINGRGLCEGLEKLLWYIESIKEILEKERAYSSDMERTLYSVRIIEQYMDAIAAANTLFEEYGKGLTSERLKGFLSEFSEVYKSDGYARMGEYVRECLEDAQTVKSFTVGINLNTRLEPTEIGIISMNSEPFVTSNFFTELFGGTAIHDKRLTPMVRFSGKSELLQRSMYLSMNDYLCKAVKKAFRDILKNTDDITMTLLSAEADLRFICRVCRTAEELKQKNAVLCYPDTDSKKTEITEAYSPLLLSHTPVYKIVPNDVQFMRGAYSVYILTGANSGGKSVYIQTAGLCQLMFQLGIFVPARGAVMRPVKCIFTHFSADISPEGGSGESRFVAECKAMKKVLSELSEDALLLMDESFSGTSSAEGAAVAAQVLKHIISKKCACIYSTHIHELTAYIDELNKNGETVMPMCVEMKDGERTYRIIRGRSDDLSHAYDIAKKYGLEFAE